MGKPPGEKVIDWFGYKLSGRWRSNPDVHAWVTRNGTVNPEQTTETPLTCGDTIIVLGLEEQHRRNMPNIEEYMLRPPYLGNHLWLDLLARTLA